MPDMLVPLYKLPNSQPHTEALKASGILIRRANPWELTVVRQFIIGSFSTGWADEASVGFTRTPVSTLIAIKDGAVLGFGSYECTRRAFFGPTGVHPNSRNLGIGRVLLLRCLEGLAEMGYAYAIIGSAGPVAFYEKACGAIPIPGSSPGIYADLLKQK